MTFIERIYAKDATDIIGKIENPLNKYGNVDVGLVPFFSNILRLIFAVAGIYAFINLILAGYGYMSAGGDTKALTKAWDKIWQTLLGLAIIAGSFVIAALFGYLLFGNPMFMLNPIIYGPGK
ncbi:MAG: hypothetical protein V1917_03175 [Candidatus Gottesmanbacteria bacterium]